MKNIIFAILFLFIGNTASSQITKAELQATGLTCAMCSNAINKALKKVPFVETVETDLNKNIFTIHFKNESQVDIDALQRAVTGAGFSVGNLWITMNFDHNAVKNDEHLKLAGLNFHFLDVKEQVLNGVERVRVVDKNYVTAKEYKKFAAKTTMDCVKTGFMSSCCKVEGEKGNRIYHVTI